jgi:hypothetical protein
MIHPFKEYLIISVKIKKYGKKIWKKIWKKNKKINIENVN